MRWIPVLVLAWGAIALGGAAKAVADDEKAAPAEQEAKPAAEAAKDQADEKPGEKADEKAQTPKPRNPLSDVLKSILKPNKKAETPRPKPAARRPVPRQPALKDPREQGSSNLNDDPRIPDPQALRKAMREARASVEKENWRLAAKQLQRILDVPQDAHHNESDQNWGSLQAEAQLLLGSLPQDELNAYRGEYEGIARRLLDEALADGDMAKLVSVARRYFHTDSGREAANRVASHYLDRGEFGLSTRWFDQLQAVGAPIVQDPKWQAKAALANKMSRTQTDEMFVFDEDDTAVLGGARQKLADWLGAITDIPLSETGLEEWPLYLGNARRTGRPADGEPLLLSRWFVPLTHSHRVETSVRQMVEDLQDAEHAVLPTIIPLMVDGKIVFRTLSGVRVVDAATGELIWETEDRISAEDIHSGESPAAHRRVRGRRMFAGFRGHMEQPGEQNRLSHLLFEDANYGIVSSDGSRLFVIEELAILTKMPQQYWNNAESAVDQLGQDWTSNKIVAYDLRTGRPLWEVGGTLHGDVFELPLAGTFFHGAPVADGGELFVVGEKDRLIELICLDAATGDVKWRQAIAQATAEIEQDVVRRWYGGQIAVGNGVVVCQTTTGLVAAVERQSHALLWTTDTAQLRRSNPARFRGRNRADIAPLEPLNKRWFPTPPIISGNRVVVTAPRSANLYCFDLITGNLSQGKLWRTAKGSNLLYLAGVYDEKVIVVGKQYVKAYSLTNGFENWNVGLSAAPSGRGVAAGDRYYLPLDSGELVGIDLQEGKIVDRLTRPPGSRGLGNLALYRGSVVSLSPAGVESFQQRRNVEQEIAERKQRDPHDPVAMLREAEIAELNRDVTTVLDRLRSLDREALPPSEQARHHEIYVRALAELIRSDFAQHDAAVEELEKLTITPAERAAYLRILADRRVARGDLAGAFDVYLELAESAEPVTIRPAFDAHMRLRDDRWLAGRIFDLWELWPDDAKAEFDARVVAVAEQYAGREADEQERWLRLFGFHPAALKIQRHLADHYAAAGNFVAAEAILQDIRENHPDEVAAEAVRRWGELLLDVGADEAAADAYALLGEQYAATELTEGKTGAEVARQARDEGRVGEVSPRFPLVSWGGQDLTAVRMGQDYSQRERLLPLVDFDDDTPYFDRHPMHVTNQDERLEIFQPSGDRYLATIPLRSNARRPDPALEVHNRGHHLLLMHQGMLHSISPLEKRVRWTRPIEGPQQEMTYESSTGTNYLLKSTLDLAIRRQDNEREGEPHIFDGRHFVYRERRKLTVLDALTGEVCWTLENVPLETTFFGGDGILYRQDGDDKRNLTAIRMLDGKTLDLPFLRDIARRARRFIGRYGLVRDASGEQALLSLRDPLTGEEKWNKTLPAKTLAVMEDDHRLLYVTSEGEFARMDLKTGRVQHFGQVDVNALKSRKTAYCVVDNQNAYLIIHWGTSRAAVRYGDNISSIRVLGKILAYDLNTAELRWEHDVKDQRHLLLAGLRNSPVLVLTRQRSDALGRRPRRTIHKTNIVALDKQTGEQVLDATVHMQPGLQNVRTSLTGRFIELQTYNERVRLMPLQSETASAPPAATE